jgi:uncharacterized membrane protein YeiH
METALQSVEVVALLAFALAGYLEAERRRMDVIGHFVLAFVTAFGGGTLRDVLLDRRPLFWVEHHQWAVAVFVLCLALPWLTRWRPRSVETAIQWPDALGLGLFAASGAAIALEAEMPLFIASLMGVVTATFGGVIRDVIVNEVPQIFRRTELYATCAFAGAWACIAAIEFIGLGRLPSIAIGASVAFGFRILAMQRGWRLPTVG